MASQAWDDAAFKARLTAEGPQRVTIGGIEYTCYTPDPGGHRSYIAIRADSTSLFTVNMANQTAQRLTLTTSYGVPAIWPVPAALFVERLRAHRAAADLPQAVHTHFMAGVILPSPFTLELIELLGDGDGPGVTRLRTLLGSYGQGDSAGSRRLQKICVEALTYLAERPPRP